MVKGSLITWGGVGLAQPWTEKYGLVVPSRICGDGVASGVTPWQAMLGYAHAGDVETSGIVDAMTRMLEWPWAKEPGIQNPQNHRVEKVHWVLMVLGGFPPWKNAKLQDYIREG